ncbi:hypothetical protein RF007C_04675 [Ruminococcus flavefaciens 007c]|uniref:POTRA domain-containing protein n=2 Tax=Ruminococcus flavefaciens TaxID=1265 RepID=W7UVR0_RUMFL|nr:hypothetical protein RF007C_04675 [Ruminococcus flavefaciens 007c]
MAEICAASEAEGFGEDMKDVEKTNVERQNSRKRIRRRKRMMNVYGLVVMLLVVTAVITISYTFLFNINEIRVSGESDMYSAEEIVFASGIKKGDNLLRLNIKGSEQKILDDLLYVETAKVERDFPSSLEITVTKCLPAFNVNYGTGTLLVSKKGKILADNGFITDGLPIIYGLDPADKTPGKPVYSENEHKNDAFTALISSLVAKNDNSVMSVDLSDEHAIIVNYKSGMIFKMGNWNDVEYKLALADEVMKDEKVMGKKGYLTMIGTNQCSFRDSDKPVANPGSDQPTTAVKTDIYGNPIDEVGEQNPDMEEEFNKINQNRTTAPPPTEIVTENSGNNDGGQWNDDNSGSGDYYQEQNYGDTGYGSDGNSGYTDDGNFVDSQW